MKLSAMLEAWGLPGFEDEVEDLIPGRRYRFDCANRNLKIAVEIQGGIWRKSGGAHTGTGHLRDLEKSNLVQLQGWMILQFTPRQFKSGAAAVVIHLAARVRAEDSAFGLVRPTGRDAQGV